MAGNPLFGKKIRDLREARLRDDPKFTLRQFATAVGISPTFLSKVERGEFDPPKAENIIKLSYSRLTKEFFSGYSVLAQLAWQARAKLVWKYRFLVFRCRLRLRNSSTTGGGSG
jgi:transcriptional regulator with XRE-family HTH domain